MLKKLKIIFLSVLFLSGLVFQAQAQSQFKGEIVNIDNANNIAFSDLTSAFLSKGDIVEVHNGAKFVTYLEVVEAKETLSRLGFVNRNGLATNPQEFANITIGAQVIRAEEGARFNDTGALLSKISETKSSNQSLQDQLRAEKILNQTIEQENIQYKAQVEELKQTISSLQQNLQNVSKILNDKIQSYE